MATRGEREARARARLNEVAAMRLLASQDVAARSTRQVRNGQFEDLPWVGDLAESHGIAMVPKGPTVPDADEVTAYLKGIGLSDGNEPEPEPEEE